MSTLESTSSTALAASSTPASQAPSWLKQLAIVSGLLGFLCFVATPLLPVNQTQSTFNWPQQDSLGSINAPLISVAPESLELSVPLSATDKLNDGETVMLSTVPPDSEDATNRGLFVDYSEEGLAVTSLEKVLLDLSAEELNELPDDAVLTVRANGDGTTVSVGDTTEETEKDLRPQVTGIYSELNDSPEVSRELIDEGLNASVEVNSRFTSTPSLIKLIAMWSGVLFTLITLFCLYRIDRLDGRRGSFMPATWKQVRPLDGIVAAILGYWHIFGANTSDDGFLLTMARVSENSGYMANYYRWYGVPESPFGSPYYDILALFAQVSTASLWMRLPALISALCIWFILSREILPRLGANIDSRRVAHWTAAFMFLAFWLPFNNGTRPEPVVALGVIFTWASFERAIATNRLLPAAIGTIAATLTLGAGPTGLFAVGAFLVALPSIFRIMASKLSSLGAASESKGSVLTAWSAMIAPFLAAGTGIMVAVFSDQTFAGVMESIRVRGEVGPALPWYSEYLRYTTLFQQTVDGSFTRRFAMFTMLFCLGLVIYSIFKHHRVRGAAIGPTQRLLLIVFFSMFFLMFTPTKWTHHFGIYAGIAGAIAALGAVVLSQIAMRSPRARSFAIASVLFLMALCLAGWNAWWYVSSFGIPWWDRTIQFKAIEANTVMLAIALLVAALGVVQSLRHNHKKEQAKRTGNVADFENAQAAKVSRWTPVMTAPIAVACVGVVVFSMLSLGKAFISQGDAYSVGKGNLRTLAGNSCALANDVMIEKDPNAHFLSPASGDVTLGESLVDNEEDNFGFDPNSVPGYIEPDDPGSPSVGAIGGAGSESAATGSTGSAGGTANTDDSSADSNAAGSDVTGAATGVSDGSGRATTGSQGEGGAKQAPEGKGSENGETGSANEETSAEEASEGGTRSVKGVNGSTINLPFNLDFRTVPVLGSYNEEQRGKATVTTNWYELPTAKENAPLLTVSVAGRIAHHDVNGIAQEGEELILEYGTRDSSGNVTNTGEAELLDAGATPDWRNMRYPLDELPEGTNVVRLVAVDDSLDPQDWIAFTPPRVPELEPLNDRFGGETPALLDWSTALQFPCQRTFDHYAGITEIPEYRVLPDAKARASLSGFQAFEFGGAMATAEAVNWSYEIPSYLNNDWARDWGAVKKYELRTDSQGNAPKLADVTYEEIKRSGLWMPSEMKIKEVPKS